MARYYRDLTPDEQLDLDDQIEGLAQHDPDLNETTREANLLLRDILIAMREGKRPYQRVMVVLADDEREQFGAASTETDENMRYLTATLAVGLDMTAEDFAKVRALDPLLS